MERYDAVIAGCGPVGAVLANLLASQGLTVCVVEKHAPIYDKPRAITFDWEGMRVLQFCGIAHDLAPSTRPHPGTDFVGIDGEIIKVFDPLPPPWDLGWPPTLNFIQPEMERLLREALAARESATMLMGWSVESFRDEGDEVMVEVANPGTGQRRTVAGDFLIGCDGANSPVREALGLALEDYGFDENWLVVDAHQQRETALPAKTTQYCWPARPATFLVGPGTLRRWELKIMPGETPEEFQDEARVRAVLAPYVDVDAFEIWRSAAYRFAARVGVRWRKGRVLLAGDAVHQTPPFLGQGLCTGVRDAANLAWKLVHIHRFGFSEALLDSYQAERRPHTATVIRHAKDFGAIIGELDEAKARARDMELSAELAAGRVQTKRQGFIPPLADGIIDPVAEGEGGAGPDGAPPLAGALMAQPRVVRPDGGTCLLDDHAPMDFLYVTGSRAEQAWMAPHAERWRALGGRRLVISETETPEVAPSPTGVEVLGDAEGAYARWRKRTGGQAVLVRPDRYVYASVPDEAGLAASLDRLTAMLGVA
ncbi:MAG: bifunctional 3-(3-hydroxy-phenyl)propionate/3-hydroxycinnamic acid hydroxylase [Bauldia litoralis]